MTVKVHTPFPLSASTKEEIIKKVAAGVVNVPDLGIAKESHVQFIFTQEEGDIGSRRIHVRVDLFDTEGARSAKDKIYEIVRNVLAEEVPTAKALCIVNLLDKDKVFPQLL